MSLSGLLLCSMHSRVRVWSLTLKSFNSRGEAAAWDQGVPTIYSLHANRPRPMGSQVEPLSQPQTHSCSAGPWGGRGRTPRGALWEPALWRQLTPARPFPAACGLSASTSLLPWPSGDAQKADSTKGAEVSLSSLSPGEDCPLSSELARCPHRSWRKDSLMNNPRARQVK